MGRVLIEEPTQRVPLTIEQLEQIPDAARLAVTVSRAARALLERGLDISYAQSSSSANLLTMLANPLYTFIICKATEGLGLDDSKYLLHRANNLKFGKRHAAYHFAWLNQDPIGECAHFVRVAALKPGEIGCLDVEDWGVTNPASTNYAAAKAMRDATTWPMRIQYVLRWCWEFKRLTGGTPAIYMNWNYIQNFRSASTIAEWAELCSYPIWLASYDTKNADGTWRQSQPGEFASVNPKVAGGITMTVWLHQWTASRSTYDFGLDGDACMDPNLWNKYAIPQPVEEDVMTDAQYSALKEQNDAILKKVSDLTTAYATIAENQASIVKAQETIRNIVAQGASGQDVTNLQKKLDAQLESLSLRLGQPSITLADDLAAQGEVVRQLPADLRAIGEDLDTAVETGVKGALKGVTISTTTSFPTS